MWYSVVGRFLSQLTGLAAMLGRVSSSSSFARNTDNFRLSDVSGIERDVVMLRADVTRSGEKEVMSSLLPNTASGGAGASAWCLTKVGCGDWIGSSREYRFTVMLRCFAAAGVCLLFAGTIT